MPCSTWPADGSPEPTADHRSPTHDRNPTDHSESDQSAEPGEVETGDGPAPVPPVRGTRIVVRIDWDALIRGWPLDGEVSEIAGLGPVPVSLVRTMIETGDPFLAAVATKGADVHTVAHLGRRPTATQQTGLDWLQPTCTSEGCNTIARLQVDHRHDWADTKITLLPWLDRLCAHHHDLKTRQNWQLVDGHGKRPMVPPDDPRHPRHHDGQRERASPTLAA